MNPILADILITIGAGYIGWLLRGWWEDRVATKFADAILDLFLTDYTEGFGADCLCDECYDPGSDN